MYRRRDMNVEEERHVDEEGHEHEEERHVDEEGHERGGRETCSMRRDMNVEEEGGT